MPSPKLDNIAYESWKFKLSWLQLLFHFHCKHSSGDTLNEWHSTIFAEVESSWRWTRLHDVLRRRFLEIYNFRNWSATHGCVYENIAEVPKRRETMIVQNKFSASFYLQIACFIALARRGIACVAVALILRWFLLRKHMCDDEVGKCVTKDLIKLYEQPGAQCDEKLLCISISRSNLTHFQIILLLCLEFLSFILYAGSISLLLTLPGSFVLFVCCNITPPGHDEDWIENFQSKKCANNGWR